MFWRRKAGQNAGHADPLNALWGNSWCNLVVIYRTQFRAGRIRHL